MPKHLADVNLRGNPDASGEAATRAYLDAVVAPLPKGIVGYSEITANSSGTSGGTPVFTGLSLVTTLTAGRRYKVGFKGAAQNSTAGQECRLRFHDAGSTQLTSGNRADIVSAGAWGFEFWMLFEPGSTGSYTFRVMVDSPNATGTAYIPAGAAYPAFVYAEDLGAV